MGLSSKTGGKKNLSKGGFKSKSIGGVGIAGDSGDTSGGSGGGGGKSKNSTYVQKKGSQIKREKLHKAIREKMQEPRRNGRVSKKKNSNNSNDDNDGDNENNVNEIGDESNEQKSDAIVYQTNAMFDEIPNEAFLELTSPQSMSRLLYPNPVCFLTTQSLSDDEKLNVMTISWLMPANNYGGFAFTIHKSRHSASLLLASSQFILSVPTALQRQLLLAVGKCSGKTNDKFDGAVIPELRKTTLGRFTDSKSQRPLPEGWRDMTLLQLKEVQTKSRVKSLLTTDKNVNKFSILEDDDSEDSESRSGEEDEDEDDKNDGQEQQEEESADGEDETKGQATEKPKVRSQSLRSGSEINDAVGGTIAHMKCRVISSTDGVDAGHHVVLAQIEKAFVHPSYWSNRGKCFVSKANFPPILTFLGSQAFGLVKASGDEFPID